MQKVIVTGAAGYIGGQTMLSLRDQGWWVMGIDWRPLPDHLRGVPNVFIQEDFSDKNSLFAINSHQAMAVVHCAGTNLVGPSVADPGEYYNNNFIKTKTLADHILRYRLPTRIIFSSSASVYGSPARLPCVETDPTMPISPYGESKSMVDWMLAAYHRAYGLNYVSFRYFNAAGADPNGRHGQEPGATHIVSRILECLRDNVEFKLFGDQFDTSDGTCLRDYVHVDDIASAHLTAINPAIAAGTYNLGTGQGHTNREIISLAEKITGRTAWVTIQPPRAGDPAILTADAHRWHSESGWRPKWSIEELVKHAWQWYSQ